MIGIWSKPEFVFLNEKVKREISQLLKGSWERKEKPWRGEGESRLETTSCVALYFFTFSIFFQPYILTQRVVKFWTEEPLRKRKKKFSFVSKLQWLWKFTARIRFHQLSLHIANENYPKHEKLPHSLCCWL